MFFTAAITVGDGEPVAHITKKDPSSAAAKDGSITLSVSGGSAPYTLYFTSTALPGKVYHEASVTLEGLPVGHYQFTIQDSKGHIMNKNIELQYR